MDEILVSNDFKAKVKVVNSPTPYAKGTNDTLLTILVLYSEFFPQLKDIEFTIIFDVDWFAPYCEYDTHNIYLKVNCLGYAQCAYQFTHELCHLCINNTSSNKVLWLEESICEMASYFFLEKMSEYWKVYHAQYLSCEGEPYYPEFFKYIQNDMKKAEPFDIANLTKNSEILAKLYKDGTNRELNAHTAISLLPIFKKYPELWKTLSYFKEIQTMDLKKFLLKWYSLTPRNLRTAMLEVLKVFGISRLEVREYQANQ